MNILGMSGQKSFFFIIKVTNEYESILVSNMVPVVENISMSN